MKRIVLLLFCVAALWNELNAQSAQKPTGSLAGRVVDKTDMRPVSGLEVFLPALKRMTVTDENGAFVFDGLNYGMYRVQIGRDADADSFWVRVDAIQSDLGVLNVQFKTQGQFQEEAPQALSEEGSPQEDEEDGQRPADISSALSASMDPYHSALTFSLSPYRFRGRSLDGLGQEVRVNGMSMEDPESGFVNWSSWGGLNDVMRNRQNVSGLNMATSGFGGWNGMSLVDASPLNLRKDRRLGYALSNRSFNNRLVATWNSGIKASGWAYSVSASWRSARTGRVPGTSFEGLSAFAGIGRRMGSHDLSLIGIAAFYERGKSLPVTQEAVDISGDRWYNPAWGYQQGNVRNARMGSGFQPMLILEHKLQTKSVYWRNSVGFQSGETGSTGLDYYQGRSPRPDYYRYMPSYFILNNANLNDPNPGSKAAFNKQQQIDWAGFYEENAMNLDSIVGANGIPGERMIGNRSITVLFRDVASMCRANIQTSLEYAASQRLRFSAGMEVASQRTDHYRQLDDLLGGDYYVNLNQFAVQQNVPDRNLMQYDLNVPDRPVYEGDIYTYHYLSFVQSGAAWAQARLRLRRIDVYAAFRGKYQSFWREGLYRNGLFADISFGEGLRQSFFTNTLRAGVELKIDGRNYLFLNGALGSESPRFGQVYISSRMNNLCVSNSQPERVQAVELGYQLRGPKVQVFASGYFISQKDRTEIRHFYNDDPAFQGFVNYVMQGLGINHAGFEFGATVKPRSSVTITSVFSWRQSYYSRNPFVQIYPDNEGVLKPLTHEVYINNFYLASGPQLAMMLGFRYQGKQNWYVGLNLIRLDQNYADFNPERRTEKAVEGLEPTSQQYQFVLAQERMPAMMSIDLSAGKSWMLSRIDRRISKNSFLYLNASLSNLLNSVLVTGGFEQLRFDYSDRDPAHFANKYFFGTGRNYLMNLSLRF